MSEVAANYKAPIGGALSTVFGVVIRAVQIFVRKIKHEPSRKIVNGLMDTFYNFIKALSDADPDDEAQIRKVLNDMFTKGDFSQGSRESILNNIEKIGNVNVKTILFILVDQAYGIAGDLTDTIMDNGDQIKSKLEEVLRTETGFDLVSSLLRIMIADPDTADTIALIILEALRGADPQVQTPTWIDNKLEKLYIQLAA